MITDCSAYAGYDRQILDTDHEAVERAWADLSEQEFIWVDVNHPSSHEMSFLSELMGLHPLAVEDSFERNQRPKVERYASHLFMSLRSVSYSDDDISTRQVSLFWGDRFLVTVRHGGDSLYNAHRRVATMKPEMGLDPGVALHAVVDVVVDRYEDAAEELLTDVEEVEQSVFSPQRTSDSTRIYRLKREALEFRRAVMPLRDPVNRFVTGAMPQETQPYFRDIADHVARAAEAVEAVEHLLDNALNAHLAQLSVQQNDDSRKLAAGATMFAVPTSIAGIYGMNFQYMPELGWHFGYPAALALMAGTCAYIYRRFKRSGWL